VLAPGCVPLFLTDGFQEYTTALLALSLKTIVHAVWNRIESQRVTQGPVDACI